LVVGFTVIFLYYLKDLKIGKILKIASIVMSILLVVFMLLVTNIISLEYFWLSKQGLGESVQSSVLKKSIESAKVRSLEIRKFQNKWYWERFLEKPLLGHGLSLNDYFVNFFGKEIGTIHNKYIEILAITGIIGFAIYFIMLAGTLKLILSVIRKDWKILFILMFSAIIIQGIFAPIDTNFWIFLGLLLAVLKITRLETRNAEN
jgi:O-antigen ligase